MARVDAAPGGGSGLRAWLAPAITLAVLLTLLIAVVVAARLTGDPGLPPVADALVVPRPVRPTLALDVERTDGTVFVVSAGQDTDRRRFELTIPAETAVDLLEPAAPAQVALGDWVTVVGVKNEVRNFAVKLIVVFPGGGTPGGDGWVRTAGGFVGHEAARETREFAVLGGAVTEVRPGELVIDSGGPVTITLTAEAPLRRVRTGTPADIRDGDRFALHDTGGDPDPSKGVLVLVGGPR